VLRRRVPLRRCAPLRRKTPVSKRRNRPRRGPARNRRYLSWIRTLDCVVCSLSPDESTFIEAAHTNILGPRGLSQKSSDFSAIPLCAGHHRCALDSYHALGEERFAREHQINLQELVLALNDRYRQQAEAESNIAP
jgi:hypothetical protein